MKNQYSTKLVLILIILITSCNNKLNHIAYSFQPMNDNNPRTNIESKKDFISVNNYIFEFVIGLRMVTDIYEGNSTKTSTKVSYDTLKVYVYDLKNDCYHSIWPFDTNFKVIEKNKKFTEKRNGLMFQNNKQTNNKQYTFKKKNINKLNFIYVEEEDSVFKTQVYFLKKKQFTSPYEAFIKDNATNLTLVGYNITQKQSNYTFSDMLSELKPLDKQTRNKCEAIIKELYSR